MTRAFLGLGSNMGDRTAELVRAVTALRLENSVVGVSNVYETEPVGGPLQENFFNIVVELDTEDEPETLLARCQALEEAANRVRTVRFGPRTLDVDILWVDEVDQETEMLTIPHPRMWERRFVLEPLRELAPDLVSDERLAAARGDVVMRGPLGDE